MTYTSYFDALCDKLDVSPNTSGWPDKFGASLQRWSDAAAERPIRTLSLFSGGGGLDIAFRDAGFHTSDLVEIEPRFAQTLATNATDTGYLGNSQVHCIDIRKFYPRKDLKIDFIIGGPPCQSFSAAGRRASGVRGINDTRGVLFQEYVRLLKTLKPRGFLFENVYGLIGANGGKAWIDIQKGFESAGYKIFSRILDAADYGVPQHRERLFIVGIKKGADFAFPRPTHGPDATDRRHHYAGGSAIATASPENRPPNGIRGKYGKLLEEIPPGLNYSFFTSNMGHPRPEFAWRSKFSDFLYKADPARPIRTLKAQGGQYTGPFHWKNRTFSVSELKRLQTFPDKYQVIGSRQVAAHQLGNSVPPQIGRLLALAVREQVFGRMPPVPLDYLSESEELGFRKRKRALSAYYQAIALRHRPSTKRRQIPLRGRNLEVSMAKNFALKLGPSSDGFKAAFVPQSETWTLRISPSAAVKQKPAFTLTLRPLVSTPWVIPANEIKILSTELSTRAFTLGWKVLESELARLRIKADLVQLCGYYQYEPAFASSLQVTGKSAGPLWQILARVCAGAGTRRPVEVRELSRIWGVPPTHIHQHAQALKELGYEVRNDNTNPEMPPNHFLIPYSFPTLNPMSVQRHKNLSKDSEWPLPRKQMTKEFAIA